MSDDDAMSKAFAALWEAQTNVKREPRPPVVCLCGSTRFYEAYAKANLEETLAGRIVLSVGCHTTSDASLGISPSGDMKAMLDELHMRKIDMADEVLVLNVDGYIGESTWRELCYALGQLKRIRFLEREAGLESLKRVLVEAQSLAGVSGAVAVAKCGAGFGDLLGDEGFCVLGKNHHGNHRDRGGSEWEVECGRVDDILLGTPPCVRPRGHEGEHQTRDGARWADSVPCPELSFNGGPCVHDKGHEGRHLTGYGYAWETTKVEAQCGHVYCPEGDERCRRPCILPSGHNGRHQDAKEDSWANNEK